MTSLGSSLPTHLASPHGTERWGMVGEGSSAAFTPGACSGLGALHLLAPSSTWNVLYPSLYTALSFTSSWLLLNVTGSTPAAPTFVTVCALTLLLGDGCLGGGMWSFWTRTGSNLSRGLSTLGFSSGTFFGGCAAWAGGPQHFSLVLHRC